MVERSVNIRSDFGADATKLLTTLKDTPKIRNDPQNTSMRMQTKV